MARLTIPTLSALSLLLVLPGPALAQVEVKTPGGSVHVGDDGVTVDAPGAKVRTGDHGVTVKTRGGKVKVGGKGVKVSPKGGKGRKAFTCGDNDDKVLDKVTIDAKGTAVTVDGNCTLVIRGSSIRGKVGVHVSGNGDVKIEDSDVTGKAASLHVSGNATVKVSGSEVHGPVKQSGNAEVERGDGNRFD